MKYLLAALNAKYIHSNLGIYSLKAYALQTHPERRKGSVELGEYTINHSIETILEKIDRSQPDVLGLSCYIWNISWVREILKDLPKIRPQTKIFLGGPEASYDAASLMEEFPCLSGIMVGEGEEAFSLLMDGCERAAEAPGDGALWNRGMEAVPGLVWRERSENGDPDRGNESVGIRKNPQIPLLDLDAIPFPYRELDDFEHRIIYYESSRGCPFSCSYCLSSIDKTVRFRSTELVKKELSFFLDRRVPQVKFVDRTFNCSKPHACEIWKFLSEHDNGVTNFHFEIAADLLTEEELALFKTMRPGLIQLEIGVQTTNPRTIEAIHRKMDLKKVEQLTARVRAMRNIHQHLDLIAGLPFEDFERFKQSFDAVYRMGPDQLQLGFLKVLKGSYMEETREDCGLKFTAAPPYEVLETSWITYRELRALKAVEAMVEIHYNSGQFGTTLALLEKEYERPFQIFEHLAAWYEAHELAGPSQSRLARYEVLYSFAAEHFPEKRLQYRDSLCRDLYLRENAKSRPSFLTDQKAEKERFRDFYRQEAEHARYLKNGYEGRDSRQLASMTHLERMSDGSLLLFDYENRDPLDHNAAVYQISLPEDAYASQNHGGRA